MVTSPYYPQLRAAFGTEKIICKGGPGQSIKNGKWHTYEVNKPYPSANGPKAPDGSDWKDPPDGYDIRRLQILSRASRCSSYGAGQDQDWGYYTKVPALNSNLTPSAGLGVPKSAKAKSMFKSGSRPGQAVLRGAKPITTNSGAAGTQDTLATSTTGGTTDSTTSTKTTTATTATPNFNTQFASPGIDANTLALFGSPRAFVTDQPVLSSISTMASSGLRCFQSAPNGDFIAWFPDYFGQYGLNPTFELRNIEILMFQLYHNDSKIVTHFGVSGDQAGIGQSVLLADWLDSQGIVSIQQTNFIASLLGLPNGAALDALWPPSFSDNFLKRYGLRPLSQEVPTIRSHVTEYMYAWQQFMISWANQYNAELSMTFMPELYPGMRIKLADHNLEVYVQSVTHQGTRDGGFTTSAVVTCPVTRDSKGNVQLLHYGFPFKKA